MNSITLKLTGIHNYTQCKYRSMNFWWQNSVLLNSCELPEKWLSLVTTFLTARSIKIVTNGTLSDPNLATPAFAASIIPFAITQKYTCWSYHRGLAAPLKLPQPVFKSEKAKNSIQIPNPYLTVFYM